MSLSVTGKWFCHALLPVVPTHLPKLFVLVHTPLTNCVHDHAISLEIDVLPHLDAIIHLLRVSYDVSLSLNVVHISAWMSIADMSFRNTSGTLKRPHSWKLPSLPMFSAWCCRNRWFVVGIRNEVAYTKANFHSNATTSPHVCLLLFKHLTYQQIVEIWPSFDWENNLDIWIIWRTVWK